MHLFLYFFLSLLALLLPQNAECSLIYNDVRPLILNVVDVVSGCYIEDEIDGRIGHIDPILLRHSYSSTTSDTRFFPHCALVVGTDSQVNSTNSYKLVVGVTAEPNGTSMVYSTYHDFSEEKEITLLPNSTRCELITPLNAHMALSAKNNLENNILRFQKNRCTITTCDGTIRSYEQVDATYTGRLLHDSTRERYAATLKNPTYYRLLSERLPNGNYFFYSYNETGELISIQTVNSTKANVLASVSFTYETDKIFASSSDGSSLSYIFNPQNYVIKILRSTKPTLIYHYKTFGKRKLLHKREHPEGRHLTINYNSQGQVSSLLNGGSQEPLFNFSYTPDTTQVIDAIDGKIVYHHEENLFTKRERYLDNKLYSVEKLTWAGIDIPKEPTIRQFFEAKDPHELKKTIDYSFDHKGNIQQEVIQKLDTPYDFIPLQFSHDHFHNLEKEITSNGVSTLYEYKPNTNLVIKKLTFYNQVIQERQFFSYNDDGYLIREVIDDGKTADENNTFKMEERSIREIFPLNENGEETIDEKYYDIKLKADVLKKRTKNTKDSQGNITKQEIYDSQGSLIKTTQFVYDTHNNCIQESNPLQQVTTYSYDKNDNFIFKEEKAKRLKTFYSFDARNCLISMKEEYARQGVIANIFEYDTLGNLTSSINRYGSATHYIYDSLSRLTTIVKPAVLDSTGKITESYWKYTYNIFDTIEKKEDPLGRVETTNFSLRGKPLSIIYPDGTKELFQWSEKGNCLRKQERNGVAITYHYDYKNRPTYKGKQARGSNHYLFHEYFQYSHFHLKSKVTANGAYYFYSYDDAGRLIQELCAPDNNSSSDNPATRRIDYEYDAASRLHRTKYWTTTQEYFTEVKEYDPLERISATWIEQPDTSKVQRINFSYDSFHNCIKKSYDTVTEEYEYTQGSRPKRMKEANSLVIDIDYNESQMSTSGQHYLEKQVIYPDNTSLHTVYDAQDREIEIYTKDESGELIRDKKQLFDALGNVRQVVETILPKPETGPQEILTTFNYHPEKKSKEKVCGEQRTYYVYNSYGDIESISYGKETHFYDYDFGANLARVRRQIGQEPQKTFLNFEYDRAGRIIYSCSPEAIKTKRAYTHLDLLATESIEDDYGTYTISYEYDRLGRVRKVTLPDRSSIEYTYQGVYLHNICRQVLDKTKNYTHFCKAFTTHGYPTEEVAINPCGRIQTTYIDGKEISQISSDFYTEDVLERDTMKRAIQISRNGKTSSLHYDTLGYPTEEQGEFFTRSYSYDSLGRRRSQDEAQLIRGYDSRRNIKEFQEFELTYNPLNQLIAVGKANTTLVTYKWDSLGRKIQRKQPSVKHEIKRFLYIGDTEIGSINPAGTLLDLKIPKSIQNGKAIGAIAVEIKYTPFAALTDREGSIAMILLSSQRKCLESHWYSIFGEEIILNEKDKKIEPVEAKSPWGYKGFRKDPVTDFISWGSYEYSPLLGRFINEEAVQLLK
ncbi:MAG: hypothetical protein JWO53_755 [Chlamydiia bacterium]|nr:hypothetical protein [Chlamydiia bacterium]